MLKICLKYLINVSLTSLNISNFDTRKVNELFKIFIKCVSLKSDKIFTSDSRIIAEFNSLERQIKNIEEECIII